MTHSFSHLHHHRPHHPPPEEKVATRVDEELHMVVALHHLKLVLLGQEGVEVVADVGVRVEDGVADSWQTGGR